MNNKQTLEKLRQMRLYGMHDAFKPHWRIILKSRCPKTSLSSILYAASGIIVVTGP